MLGTLTKWGNSQGVILPKKYCVALGIKPGDELDVVLRDETITIEPKRKHTLNALMEGYDGPMPEEYDWGLPRGREVW